MRHMQSLYTWASHLRLEERAIERCQGLLRRLEKEQRAELEKRIDEMDETLLGVRAGENILFLASWPALSDRYIRVNAYIYYKHPFYKRKNGEKIFYKQGKENKEDIVLISVTYNTSGEMTGEKFEWTFDL